jgi:tripartite-type tricarboxylate transporter receptor subunit TctC
MLRILFCALAAYSMVCSGQTFPNQPIRMIAPFPPGGSVDIMARLIADPLARELGGKIVIDNRSGASGNIGMEAAARATPDGYTLVLNTIPLATNQALFEKLSWDPVKDFAPIGMVATAPHVLVIPAKVKANTVEDLVKMARANPGRLNYASAGVGTTFHLCAEMFKDSTHTFIVHVPYRGGGPALLDTLAGQVDMSFPTLSAALPHVKAGTLRALAVTTAQRNPSFPDIPTAAEAGVAGYDFSSWGGVFAPARTPRPVINKLNTEIVAALGNPELSKRFGDMGLVAKSSTPEEFGKFLQSEITRWSAVLTKKP